MSETDQSKESDEALETMQTGLSVAHTAAEGTQIANNLSTAASLAGNNAELAETINEGLEVNQVGKVAGGGAGGLANVMAPLALASGVYDMYKNTVGHEGSMDVSNYAGATAGAAETFAGGVGTMGLVGSGLEMAGAAEAGGAAVEAAAALGPAAAVAGAGAAGYGVGHMLADWTEGNSAANGNFGVDADTGKNKSAFDAAADDGMAVQDGFDNLFNIHKGDDSVGDTLGMVAGGVTAGAMGIANTGVNLAEDAWHGITSLF